MAPSSADPPRDEVGTVSKGAAAAVGDGGGGGRRESITAGLAKYLSKAQGRDNAQGRDSVIVGTDSSRLGAEHRQIRKYSNRVLRSARFKANTRLTSPLIVRKLLAQIVLITGKTARASIPGRCVQGAVCRASCIRRYV